MANALQIADTNIPDRLLTEKQVARSLGFTPRALLRLEAIDFCSQTRTPPCARSVCTLATFDCLDALSGGFYSTSRKPGVQRRACVARSP
jgi:hypothetical protein